MSNITYDGPDQLKEMYDNDVSDVLFSTTLIWKYYNLINPPERRFRYTIDRLFMYCPVFYFTKNSLLKDIFNDKLQLLRETGLLEYWLRKYTDDRKTKPNQRSPEKFGIDTISGPFEICIVMYSISFIVLILEIISVKCRRIKYYLDFLTY